MNHWLIKSEESVFSIDDLKKNKKTHWDGVRNYQARNILRDQMKVGDLTIFYHSNAEPSGAAGVCKVVREGYPDHTAFDRKDIHYDPKSDPTKPTWYMVDVEFVEKFPAVISLGDLKKNPALSGMTLFKSSQLSVQPVTKKEFETILSLSKK